MEGELLSLKWNNHRTTFLHVIGTLRSKAAYTDATIACEGKFYPVHKLVLSTCSEYFGAIFEKTPCKSPVVVLKDIECKNLEFLLDYMYVGEVNVRQNELAALIKAAECLKIKGLAVPDEEPSSYSPPFPSSKGRADSQRDSSPPAKRRRNLQQSDSSDKNREPHVGLEEALGLDSNASSAKDNDASDEGGSVAPIKLEPLEENDIAEFIPNSNERVSDKGGGASGSASSGIGEREDSTNDMHEFFKTAVEKEEPIQLGDYSSADFPGPSGIQNSNLSQWDSENSFQPDHLGLSPASSQQESQQQQQLFEHSLFPQTNFEDSFDVKECFVRLLALSPNLTERDPLQLSVSTETPPPQSPVSNASSPSPLVGPSPPKRRRGRPKKKRGRSSGGLVFRAAPVTYPRKKKRGRKFSKPHPQSQNSQSPVIYPRKRGRPRKSDILARIPFVGFEVEDPLACTSSNAPDINQEDTEEGINGAEQGDTETLNDGSDYEPSSSSDLESSDPLYCQMCDFVSHSSSEISKHVLEHNEGELHEGGSENPEGGSENPEAESELHCPECSYVTNRKRNLNFHIQNNHVDIKPLACSYCLFRTGSKCSLYSHIYYQHSRKVYKCNVCRYTSVKPYNLRLHIAKKHQHLKPYLCSKCSYRTSIAAVLFQHERNMHNPNNHFPCKKCNSYFQSQGHLDRHLDKRKCIYTADVKVFNCTLCKYVAESFEALRKHKQNDHKGQQKRWNCKSCSYRAESLVDMRNHIKSKHPGLPQIEHHQLPEYEHDEQIEHDGQPENELDGQSQFEHDGQPQIEHDGQPQIEHDEHDVLPKIEKAYSIKCEKVYSLREKRERSYKADYDSYSE